MNDTINAQTIDLATDGQAIVASAQRQWFSRPADQKFASVEDVLAFTSGRRDRSYEVKLSSDQFRATESNGHVLFSAAGNPLLRGGVEPTNYAFGQAASLVGYSGRELRKLHDRPELVTSILNHFLTKRGEDVKALVVDAPEEAQAAGTDDVAELFALTAPTYGRIWDADVVEAGQRIVDATEGRFYSPLDWTRAKRALFASDRDVFLFFIDGGSIVDGGGERDQLNRGFFLWNSEVGAKTFGISTFLFRQVCGNFGVWGAEDVRALKIRHTSGGPERFVTEAIPALREFVNASAKPLEEKIRKAKAISLPGADADIITKFKAEGFTAPEIKRAIQFADVEEGSHGSLWDLYNGFTAAARHIAYVDAKLDLETRAGRLLDKFAV